MQRRARATDAHGSASNATFFFFLNKRLFFPLSKILNDEPSRAGEGARERPLRLSVYPSPPKVGEGVESLLQHLVGVGGGQQWHLMITSISSSLLSPLIADHSGGRRHTWEQGGLNAAAGRDAALQLLTALQSCRPSFEPLAPVELHNRTSNNLAQPGTPPPPNPNNPYHHHPPLSLFLFLLFSGQSLCRASVAQVCVLLANRV